MYLQSNYRNKKYFNPEFECKNTIYDHLNSINAIYEINNERLVSCSDDHKI